MFHITYVLKSRKDGFLYVGYTCDLDKRLEEHNSGKVEATKNRTPFVLAYAEICRSKHNALKREKYFKTGFGRRFLKHRI